MTIMGVQKYRGALNFLARSLASAAQPAQAELATPSNIEPARIAVETLRKKLSDGTSLVIPEGNLSNAHLINLSHGVSRPRLW